MKRLWRTVALGWFIAINVLFYLLVVPRELGIDLSHFIKIMIGGL